MNDPIGAIVFGTIITLLFWTVMVAIVAYKCGVDRERADSKDRNDESIVRTLTHTITLMAGRPGRSSPAPSPPRWTHPPDPTMPHGSDGSNPDPAGLGGPPRRNGQPEPEAFEAYISGE